tara:strand:- start:8954 stop:9601 length:648 start_codon:yes stop_codon:yes gene_type:complete
MTKSNNSQNFNRALTAKSVVFATIDQNDKKKKEKDFVPKPEKKQVKKIKPVKLIKNEQKKQIVPVVNKSLEEDIPELVSKENNPTGVDFNNNEVEKINSEFEQVTQNFSKLNTPKNRSSNSPMELLQVKYFDKEKCTPKYPRISLRRGEMGQVTVRVLINEDGSSELVSLVNSSGFERLDDAALSAARNCRFISAKRNGVAVKSTAQIPYNFVYK